MVSEPPAPGDAHRRVELLASLVDQISDHAVVGLDLQGTIVSWNAGAEAVTGYAAPEVVGRSWTMFSTEDDRRRGLPGDLLRTVREQGRAVHSGWRLRRDGRRFWADVVVTALHDAEGRLTGFVQVTRDLTAQHDLEVLLRDSEERLRLLVGQVVDYAIIALDPQGTIETWNLGAARLKGYSADEAVGRSFATFYTPEDQRDGLPARLLETARRRGRVQSTGWRVRRDGSRFWADVTITALHDGDGRLTGYAKVTRDRTDLKRLEEAQDSFYASFTHDFRTPVTVIKGFVDALREASDDPEVREALLDRIDAGADRLLAMVHGLVDFARQRVPDADLRVDDIDVADVARQAVLALGPAAAARVRVEETVSLARADGEAMTRVVTNLVVNALKYSQAGVEVGFGRDGDDVVLTVSDRGRGIHADDLTTIFEQFERGRLATDDGGTGLGLASARDLVQQQHGTIGLESRVGDGTRVTVRLPAATAADPHAGGAPARSTSDAEPA